MGDGRQEQPARLRPPGPGAAPARAARVAAALACAWALACGGGAEAPGEPEWVERLQALGYVDWPAVPAAERRLRGVVRHDPQRSQPGVNLYSSRWDSRAYLVDMRGRALHTWRATGADEAWSHVELAPDGGVFAIAAGDLVRLDVRSRERWRLALRAHHDLALDSEGRVYALSREWVPLGAGGGRALGEAIAVVSPDGRLLRRVPLHPLLSGHLPPQRLRALRSRSGGLLARWLRGLRGGGPAGELDLYHANSLQVLPRDVPGLGARGHLLLSLRALDRLLVVDLDTPREVWSWGAEQLEEPHHATLLDDGGVLVFDNGTRRGYSRVLALEPATGRVTWEYSGEPPGSLFSRRKGGCQRLANGNVLVVESERGRALEVTPSGETVWEFLNPARREQGARRGSIWRMTRLDVAGLPPLLAARVRAAGPPGP